MYMKKIFSFIAGVAAAMSLQAASYTEAVQITMTCAGGPESQKVNLFVDPAQASVEAIANIATVYEDGQVNFYVVDGAAKYSQYKANAISNLPLAIVTNRRDVSYTFTFNAPIATEGLVLTDLRSVDGIKNIPMVNGDSYTFSVDGEANYVANTNITIADRFVINYVAPAPAGYNVTLNGSGLATFSAVEVTAIPAGLRAFYAGEVENDVLQLDEIFSNIPAETGVILYGEANTNHILSISSATPSPVGGNTLQPYTEWANRSTAKDYYILHGSELWHYTGSEFPDNKAYLMFSGSNAPQRIRMVFNGAQGVENVEVEAVKAEKFYENGQLFIRRGNEVYNVQGQLVK